MQKWQDFKKVLLKDPDMKREFNALRPQYELAARVIELRLQRGLSQAQLAKKIGTGQSAIARLESGEYNPSIVFFGKSCQGNRCSAKS